MYFPLADIEVAPWVPPLAAFVISFFTSMGGVSGAFLLLPFQMSVLGASNPSLSATNQFYNIVAIPLGVLRYIQERRMVWPLAWAIVGGTLPGVLVGALIRVTLLPDKRSFLPFAAAVLAFIGLRVVLDIARKKTPQRATRTLVQTEGGPALQRDAPARISSPTPGVTVLRSGRGGIAYTFHGERFEASVPKILAISGIVGVVGGIYGIGGGSIIAPVLTSCMALPVHTVAGAALLGTLATSVAGVLFYLALAPFFPHLSITPDWMLGLLFGVGGMAGMYLGARCQKFVPPGAIKCLLAAVLLFTAGKYLLEFLG